MLTVMWLKIISGTYFDSHKSNLNLQKMNFNNFTIKSQEAVQRAQQIAQGYQHQQIENAHILKGILEVDENVTPYILKKLGL